MRRKQKQMMVWLDPETHRAFKAKAINEGNSMAALMESWIEAYIAAPVPSTRDQINAIGRTVTEAAEAGITLDDLRAACPDNFDAALAAFMDTGYGRIDGERVYLVPGGV